MSAPISAKDLVPHAFEAAAEAEDTLEYDLGNLAAFDTQPVDPAAFAGGREAKLLELALTGTQALITKLFHLPVTPSDAGPLVCTRMHVARVAVVTVAANPPRALYSHLDLTAVATAARYGVAGHVAGTVHGPSSRKARAR